jgi:hypothetical protein
MQTNISQSDSDRVEAIIEASHVKTSRVSDSKNIFKSEGKEEAIKKRYGKDVKITITYDMNGNKLKELTQRYQSVNNKVYSITEYFTEMETTEYCILCCRRNNRNFEYKYDRFLDAEVSLMDLIAEE